jgi:nuclear RNA export factor
MFSSQTAASGSRAIAASALRNAGLMDRDTPMHDASDTPGGRKSSSRTRVGRNRKHEPSGASARSTASKTLAPHIIPATDPLSIRGAARPTAAGRLRRNAVSSGSSIGAGSSTTPRQVAPRVIPATKPKLVEHWREVVKKRWNPETRFLNLEVSIVTFRSHLVYPARNNGTWLPTVYPRHWSKMRLSRNTT